MNRLDQIESELAELEFELIDLTDRKEQLENEALKIDEDTSD